MNSYRKMVLDLGPKRPIMATPSFGGLKIKGVFDPRCPGVVVLGRHHLDDRVLSNHKLVSIPENESLVVFRRGTRPVSGSLVKTLRLESIDEGHSLHTLFQGRKSTSPFTIDYRDVLSSDCTIPHLAHEERELVIAVAMYIRAYLEENGMGFQTARKS